MPHNSVPQSIRDLQENSSDASWVISAPQQKKVAESQSVNSHRERQGAWVLKTFYTPRREGERWTTWFWGRNFYLERSSLTHFLCQSKTKKKHSRNSFHRYWINKLTLKDDAVLYRFALFTCGGPCHLSSFKQCSEDLVYLWEQLVYSVIGINK